MSDPKFLPYQKSIYNDKSRYIIINKGRQIGVSTILAYKAAVDCIFNNRSQIIVSASQRQSNHINTMISKYIHTLISLAKSKGIDTTLTTDTKSEKGFSNGKCIYTLPCSPNTVRGFSGDVWIDEFSLHRYDKEMFTALTPIITHGYNITISSTPLGQNNMFHTLYTDIDQYPNWKRYNISIVDAIADGLDIKLDEIKNSMDDDSFRQEYMCEFIDEATAYLPYDLIKKCITDIDATELKGEYYIGIDIGRINDRTEIIVLLKQGDMIFIVDNISMKNTPFDEQYMVISNTILNYNPISVYGDASGLGRQLMEQLSNNYPSVQGVVMTNNNKLEMLTNLKMLMEKGLLRFKADEDTLVRQLHSIRKTTTANNNTKFTGANDSTGHYDKVIALSMGLLSIKSGNSTPQIFFL